MKAPVHSCETSIAEVPGSASYVHNAQDHVEIIRLRCIATLSQVGGIYREQAIKKLRKILESPSTQSMRFLRWMLSPGVKVEHFFDGQTPPRVI